MVSLWFYYGFTMVLLWFYYVWLWIYYVLLCFTMVVVLWVLRCQVCGANALVTGLYCVVGCQRTFDWLRPASCHETETVKLLLVMCMYLCICYMNAFMSFKYTYYMMCSYFCACRFEFLIHCCIIHIQSHAECSRRFALAHNWTESWTTVLMILYSKTWSHPRQRPEQIRTEHNEQCQQLALVTNKSHG